MTTVWHKKYLVLTNQERANNGFQQFTWDSDMASYSDRRAMEIVTDFSHNSAGGNWSVGENIGQEGETSASEVVNDWMNSEGHKANILSQYRQKHRYLVMLKNLHCRWINTVFVSLGTEFYTLKAFL